MRQRRIGDRRQSMRIVMAPPDDRGYWYLLRRAVERGSNWLSTAKSLLACGKFTPHATSYTVSTLRAQLSVIDPPVRRRIRVDGNITLRKLHRTLQAAFGWTDAHLHEFEGGWATTTTCSSCSLNLLKCWMIARHSFTRAHVPGTSVPLSILKRLRRRLAS